jgi:hypothetical protein
VRVCVCVCMYVCIYVCMYVCVHVYMYLCTYVRVDARTHVRMYVCMYVYLPRHILHFQILCNQSYVILKYKIETKIPKLSCTSVIVVSKVRTVSISVLMAGN